MQNNGHIEREGSRPRDPGFAEPHVLLGRATKIYLATWHVFPARGDARPPRITPANTGLQLRPPYSVVLPSIDRINRSSAAS